MGRDGGDRRRVGRRPVLRGVDQPGGGLRGAGGGAARFPVQHHVLARFRYRPATTAGPRPRRCRRAFDRCGTGAPEDRGGGGRVGRAGAAVRVDLDRRRPLDHGPGRARVLRRASGTAGRRDQLRRPLRRAQLRAWAAQRHAFSRHRGGGRAGGRQERGRGRDPRFHGDPPGTARGRGSGG